ncbi:MAG: glucans biosynthesis glucosyltransferase MdoH, partial [Geminicoccaceae bacterium]
MRPSQSLRWRRRSFATVCLISIAALVAFMLRLLSADGFGMLDALMLLGFCITTPWLVIGFWNALIGFTILHSQRDPLGLINPLATTDNPNDAITARVAIVMPVYNEDPEGVFRHLRTTIDSLDATGQADGFEIFLLSDSNVPAIYEEEMARFQAWRESDPRPIRLHYRRRHDNIGKKSGNIRDFCERWGHGFDHMVVLDADSLMSGDAILRLVRLMQRHPQLGILQTLVVGLPSASPFARVFQFGMRHGMRSFTTGSAWWQGDEGPYWGHNAIIRLAPFIDHCHLPTLPGKPPLGGVIMSHDQVEAVYMRRAGYEVRVLPMEDGSYEVNPPSVLDFMKRELRWTQGNMQYFRLLDTPGLRPLGRLQLLLAILMYLSAGGWMTFVFAGMVMAATYSGGGEFLHQIHPLEPILLFTITMSMTFAPKIFGVIDVLMRERSRQAYGGTGPVIGGALLETAFSFLLGPVMAFAESVLLVRLPFGRTVSWNAQQRRNNEISWREAVMKLWPQTLVGVVCTLLLAMSMP